MKVKAEYQCARLTDEDVTKLENILKQIFLDGYEGKLTLRQLIDRSSLVYEGVSKIALMLLPHIEILLYNKQQSQYVFMFFHESSVIEAHDINRVLEYAQAMKNIIRIACDELKKTRKIKELAVKEIKTVRNKLEFALHQSP